MIMQTTRLTSVYGQYASHTAVHDVILMLSDLQSFHDFARVEGLDVIVQYFPGDVT